MYHAYRACMTQWLAGACCGSRLHVAGFYSRTRADGYQDPATRPSPAVTTRMQRARPRFNFSITTRMIAAAPASSSLKHACSSPQCTDERATAVPSIGPTLFDDGAALSFHQTFDRIADGAHVAAGTRHQRPCLRGHGEYKRGNGAHYRMGKARQHSGSRLFRR